MQTIIETVQTYVNTIVTAAAGVLTAFVLGGLNKLKTKVNVWLEARTTAAQREVIHKVAGEAFALAQTAFKEAGGERKLQEALQYTTLRLAEQGITVSAVEIRSAIEKAYLEYNSKRRQLLQNHNQTKKLLKRQLRRQYHRWQLKLRQSLHKPLDRYHCCDTRTGKSLKYSCSSASTH
ncbi:phage holin, LLH family [Paenibacillus sp. FSL L8-0158]|uniref:phage holin, LLH family n=1 Tax=Paenibacillus sp. FSL L8-0158 TaxID=2954752 RepID=UPI0031595ABB